MPALIRTLRLRDLLFLFIGSVIGSGIFLSPGLILRQVNGSVGLSMLVWIAGGVMSLLGALTYAELAAANPEAGGLYCYIRDGFGRLPAFLYGWCLFLVISAATIAALARAFSQYLAEVVPLSEVESNVAAVLMIAVVTVVNVRGTRQSSNLQNWTTLVKAGLIVVLSGVLLALGKHGGEIIPAAGTQLHDAKLFFEFRFRDDCGVVGVRGLAVRDLLRGRSDRAAENFPARVSARINSFDWAVCGCGDRVSGCSRAGGSQC